ncbi:MAG: hypothetical protein QOJ87_2569 [Verrucomicrobiota bacterium]|jgi:predicted acylesterase/phospholipase RssA
MADFEAPTGWSYDFRSVLHWELDRFEGKPLPPKPTDAPQKVAPQGQGEPVSGGQSQARNDDGQSGFPDPIERAHAAQLVGLAFSGGGIRSATFNLGVLQALARLRLLRKFNYLSTVSGGGYIGSWLMAWMKRRGVLDVWAQLRPERGRQAGGAEVGEIHFLRQFSNYLTPKLGWLGADMWTVIAVYIRNLTLNLIVLSSSFAVLLIFPRGLAVLPRSMSHQVSLISLWLSEYGISANSQALTSIGFLTVAFIAFAALVYAANGIVRSMRYFGLAEEKNNGREVIEDLETKSGWCDAAGTALSNAFTTEDGFFWYAPHLDDFVFEVQFRFTGDGSARVYLWAPVARDAKKPRIDEAVVVHLAGPDQPGPPTGSIGRQKPVRPAAIEPGLNGLEITAVDGRCTVRVNDQTINSARIDLRARVEKHEPFGGILAIEHKEIRFEKLKITKIEPSSGTGSTQADVQRRIVLPLCLAAFLAIFLFGFGNCSIAEQALGYKGPISMRHWFGFDCVDQALPFWVCGLIAGSVSALIAFGTRWRWAYRHNRKIGDEMKEIWPGAVAIFLAAGLGGIASWSLFQAFEGRPAWEVLVWGPPAMLGAFLITTILHLGLLGRFMRDERREWWSRLSAWLLIYSLGWISVVGVAFYGPLILRGIVGEGRAVWGTITFAWLASTLSGLIAARGAATGRQKSKPLVDFIANAAPYVFVAGFVIVLSAAVDALLACVSHIQHNPDAPRGLVADQWEVLYGTDPWWLVVLFIGFAALALGLSLCLDINQFSMHMLYRNRLGRCYLGASNRLRRAQPFTGFSSDDDLELAELGDHLNFSGKLAAPYPIINAALNLVGGQELAWQQRKAASFIFTPFHCGYEFPELPPGYCDTRIFASKAVFSRKPSAMTLATAMAVSGAAASPNMGYHSAPAPAFLMTVFNVRLGWWLGNPRKRDGYERSGPLNVLGRLICELFGMTNDRGRYVYLSDGGHFENLGIYELVRRRCRFIVACDAEEDRAFEFGGLGNAIEKCRSDFGVDIDIDVKAIRRRSERGHSECHCAVGTIRYSRVDHDARDGILIYIKSSLTGDEPTDVLRYAASNPGFPHQSTGDQWFDESQFESYRVLGFHVAEKVFTAIGERDKLRTITNEDLFVRLAEAWHPPSSAPPDAFTKHTRSTVRIYDQLRNDPHLAFLSEQIYPEWWVLLNTKDQTDTLKPIQQQLPTDHDELKAGFYLCNSVLQLFEDAYVDLNLEEECDHPDNRGWMNLFNHWSWSAMLRVTWTICASNYGARFQTFCQRRLGLEIGQTDAREVYFGSQVEKPDRSAPYPWESEIQLVAVQIQETIWQWLGKLPVGSKIIAKAALEADKEAPGSQSDDAIERAALAEAKRKVADALGVKTRHIPAPPVSGDNDEEWFAAATLLDLCRRHGVPESKKQEWAKKVASFVLYSAAIIFKRFSSKDFDEQLTSVERELIKLFFIFNPGLTMSAEIRRLEVTPDKKAPPSTPAQRHLHFPFGFAITALTKRPQDPAEKRPLRRLVYFRVQDHVRRMGLARDALVKLVAQNNQLEADLRNMHPAAHEVPTDKAKARFLRLFDSVRNTALQRKARVRIQLD